MKRYPIHSITTISMTRRCHVQAPYAPSALGAGIVVADGELAVGAEHREERPVPRIASGAIHVGLDIVVAGLIDFQATIALVEAQVGDKPPLNHATVLGLRALNDDAVVNVRALVDSVHGVALHPEGLVNGGVIRIQSILGGVDRLEVTGVGGSGTESKRKERGQPLEHCWLDYGVGCVGGEGSEGDER